MKRTPKPTAARTLFQLLWRSPLIALPMAAFIWFRDSAKGPEFGRYYLPTVVFVFAGWLSLWATQFFLFPRVIKSDLEDRRTALLRGAFYIAAMLLGFTVAALTLNATIVPRLLGTPRDAAIVGMYGVLFIVLSLGLGFAAAFYRRVEERARGEHELRLARRIQSSFLPTQFPNLPGLDVSARNVPSKEVSGDFYDVVPAGDSAVLFAIADVAGKGVPAALLSSMLQASLRTQAMSIPSVATILGNINSLIYRSTSMGQFATFFLARFEPGTGRLCYTNAGHNPPVLFRAGAGRQPLEHGGPVVGVLESVEYEVGTVTLAPGDRLLLYSDGLTEAASSSGELFGEDRLCRLIESSPANDSCRDLTQRILDTVHNFTGVGEPEDDMTVLLLRVRDETQI